jgi:hypothetical protein
VVDQSISDADPAQPIFVVDTERLLVETLGRLRRANDGLRQVESGDLGVVFVKLIRQEVAQAAMDVETLLKR